jgi:exosortase
MGTSLSMTTSLSSLDQGSTALENGEKQHYGLSEAAWLKIGVVAVLMAALFRFNLVRLWLKTNPLTGEANWGHSLFVPLVGIYFLYIHREGLARAKVQTAWSGLLILLAGILLFVYGIYPGQNDFVKDFGMVVTLFGLVLFLCGWEVMKIAWFPIVFLVCAIPWPGLVYSWVATPLQRLAAEVAVKTLMFVGVGASCVGTKIFIVGKANEVRTLNVAEACAGMRSLMTFVSVAAAVAFLSSRPLWQKILITLFAIPIAIFCNVMRVSGQGLLDHFVSVELSQSFAHAFVGTIMLIPGFFMILLGGWFLDKVFIEEVDDEAKQAAAASQASWSRQTSTERVIEIPRKAPTATVVPVPPPPVSKAVAAPRAQAPAAPAATPVVKAPAPVAKAPTPAVMPAAAAPATKAPAPVAPVKPAAPWTSPVAKPADAPKGPVNIPIPPVNRPRGVMPPRPNIPRSGGSTRPPTPPTPPGAAGGPGGPKP